MILTSSYAIQSKAGAGIDSAIASSNAFLAFAADLAEKQFCGLTRKDWLTNLPDATISGAISDAVSDLAAMKLINYNMSGYTSRAEAQTMLDVLSDNCMRIVSFLKEAENQKLNK